MSACLIDCLSMVWLSNWWMDMQQILYGPPLGPSEVIQPFLWETSLRGQFFWKN